jgi:methylenetetrahydrofolate dehydrogenase (NADP+) / methenyltetrahydrofolate cyclohydrolase
VTAKIIDGRIVARKLRAEYRVRVQALKNTRGITPGLAVVLLGDNPASQLYVRNKIRACEELGLRSQLVDLPADVTEAQLLEHIGKLNDDPSTHGVLVQLPLPPHIAMRRVLESIAVHKDVDGFHLYNVGGLVTGSTVFSPCTPYGVQKLLEHERIEVAGRSVRRRRQQHRRQTHCVDVDAAACDGQHLSQENARPRAIHLVS